ncbi:hypothetical protein [Burkholderia cenocepacia]|uniref:hypothetical protein n=1 Tax=Burkholderia cenocepacia TaxID=95486 RepID=UPI001FC7D00F|nr:hypothetical protein [Burkholderia cenocepacia]
MTTQSCSNFSQAFEANMAALHLLVPTTLFATLQTSLASVTSMMTTLKALGPNASVAELAGATTKLEMLGVAGSILASAYIGAVIGSLIVATDSIASCKPGANATIAITRWADRHGLMLHPLVLTQLLRHPEILEPAPYSNFDQRKRVALKGAVR